MKNIKHLNIFSILLLIISFMTISCSNLVDTLSEVKINYFTPIEGVEIPTTKTVQPNYSLTSSDLPDVKVDGYHFDGWFIGDSSIHPGYIVKKDITLVAQLKKIGKTPNVMFIPSSNSNLIDYNQTVELKCPTTDGAVAKIYYTTDNTNPEVVEKNLYKEAIPITKETTIKAIAIVDGLIVSDVTQATYKIKTYTVTFYTNGTTPKIITATGYKGQSLSAELKEQLNAVNKEYNKLDGWYDISNKKVNLDTFKIVEDCTLIAQWIQDVISDVEYSGKDGTVDSITGNPIARFDMGEKITLSNSTLGTTIYYTLGNKEFPDGWIKYDAELGFVPNSPNDFTIKFFATKDGMNKSNVTTVLYKANKYTVSFIVDETKGKTPTNLTNLPKGHELTNEELTITPIENTGFGFSKWIDNNGQEIKAGDKVTKSLTLTAVWDDIKPGEITAVKVNNIVDSVELTWTNPQDIDLSKFIISGIGTEDIELTDTTTTSYKFIGLNWGTEYNINFKIVDKGGNETIVPIKFTTNTPDKPFIPTETPTTYGNREINGTSYNLVTFGDWPQTLKKSDVTVSTGTIKVNGWDCYYGTDGGYYVKLMATPKGGSPFQDGTEIETGKEYYFKIEPLQWRILTDNYNGNMLLFSEAIIDANKMDVSDYSYSSTRNFLNSLEYESSSGFLKKAFTQNAINKILDTTLTDSRSVSDKIFILNMDEYTNKDYGFVDSRYNNDPEGVKKETDYSKAHRLQYYNVPAFTQWWLRSNTRGSYHVVKNANGSSNTNSNQYKELIGVVPALVINSDTLIKP